MRLVDRLKPYPFSILVGLVLGLAGRGLAGWVGCEWAFIVAWATAVILTFECCCALREAHELELELGLRETLPETADPS